MRQQSHQVLGLDPYLTGLQAAVSSKFGKKEEKNATPQISKEEREKATVIERKMMTKDAETSFSTVQQLFMYVGIFVGVILSNVVSQLQSGGVALTLPNSGKIFASAVIALIITPIAYGKLSLDPSSPYIVKFGLFVQSGVFWHLVIDSIAKLA